jgi:hypothetical protein
MGQVGFGAIFPGQDLADVVAHPGRNHGEWRRNLLFFVSFRIAVYKPYKFCS